MRRGLVGRALNGRPRCICNKIPGSAHCGKIAVYASLADDEIAGQVLATWPAPPS